MVTIKGGVLKGGTTRKKKHYMDDRKPQEMRATGYSAGTKVVSKPKKLEGALNQKNTPKAKPKANANKPKAKPSRTSKPMPASTPRAQGKAKRETSTSISRETGVGNALATIVGGSASRTVADRKKRAKQIRTSYDLGMKRPKKK